MTSAERPDFTPDMPPSEREGLLSAPKTHEEWQLEVRQLEAERDAIAARLQAEGIEPLLDPDFNFLLGRVSTAHEQLIAHALKDLRDDTL